MEEQAYIPEESYTEEVYTENPEGDYMEGTEEAGETSAPSSPSDPEDIQERIDGLLDQIGAGYGSMGDYYIPDAGCYAFPGEDVFCHFVAEEERPGWTAASNGCIVPAGSLDAYEAYLASRNPEDATDMEDGTEGEEPLPPPVTQEDITGLLESLSLMYGQDASYYETSVLHMEKTEASLQTMQSCLANIFVTDLVICFFLALLCGAVFADVFFSRMRAG